MEGRSDRSTWLQGLQSMSFPPLGLFLWRQFYISRNIFFLFVQTNLILCSLAIHLDGFLNIGRHSVAFDSLTSRAMLL